jgi:uracil phosphoribosyltransferase
MLDGMARLLPDASSGHIGIYRNESTLQPTMYYSRLPANLDQAQVVLVDPMLATGNSACEAVGLLKSNAATRIQFVCIIACSPGLGQLQSRHPDVRIFTAAIDPELNESGSILPGLVDAGDRYFGTG